MKTSPPSLHSVLIIFQLIQKLVNVLSQTLCAYLLLYGGQQVFEYCQLGHKVLQLLVTFLIHRLVETKNN